MKDYIVMRLLKQVKSGEVSLDDARAALEDVSLSEDAYNAALDHGVCNNPLPGTVVRATISPSGESILVILLALWGVLWTLFWAGSLTYGLFKGWDQQILSFSMGMTFLTVIILGIVYLKYVLPDVLIVKHRGNKYITPNDPEGWKDYEV